jgi:hypothetical protein
MTTKASQIMALHKQGHTTRVIAEIVYGLTDEIPYKTWDQRMAYVRIVVKQRKGKSLSVADKRYLKNGGREKRAQNFVRRYWDDPKFRADHLAGKRRSRGLSPKATESCRA